MLNRRSQHFAAWSGVIAVVLMVVGLLLAHMIPWGPQPDPKASAVVINHFYVAHLTGIRFGSILCMCGWAFFLVWGIGLAIRARQIEGDRVPFWAWVQIACVGCGSALASLFGMFWAIAAYRAGAVPPEITRTLNDIGWFWFVVPVPPFCMWCIAIAIPILSDRNVDAILPRWFAYLSIFNAIALLEDFFMVFFKSGALGWKGVICVYFPLGVFCVWMLAGTFVLLEALKADGAELRTSTGPVTRGEARYVPQPIGG